MIEFTDKNGNWYELDVDIFDVEEITGIITCGTDDGKEIELSQEESQKIIDANFEKIFDVLAKENEEAYEDYKTSCKLDNAEHNYRQDNTGWGIY